MRALALISLLAALPLLHGCRATSETRREDMEWIREAIARMELERVDDRHRIDSILTRYTARIKRIERRYAAPDSSGRQPIASETTYEILLEGDGTATSSSESHGRERIREETGEREAGKLASDSRATANPRPLGLPGWAVATALAIMLISLIVFILRR